MTTATHTIAPVSGYAFELPGAANWRRCPNDFWELGVFTPNGREVLVGTRWIDGALCHVWRLDDMRGGFVAQTVVMTRR